MTAFLYWMFSKNMQKPSGEMAIMAGSIVESNRWNSSFASY